LSQGNALDKGWFIRHRKFTKSVAPTSVAVFPFLLGSLIRFGSLGLTWATFNLADLAIGVTFLTLYSVQELWDAKITRYDEVPLKKPEIRQEVNAEITVAFLCACVLVALFALVVNGQVSPGNPNALHIYDSLVVFFASISIVLTSQMREHFRPYDD
jgi:membrane-bound metal-dependent hydrolase YbcI (DUF457 family)